MAAKYGSLEVAKLLLQRRACPDSAGKVLLGKKKSDVCWILKEEPCEICTQRRLQLLLHGDCGFVGVVSPPGDG